MEGYKVVTAQEMARIDKEIDSDLYMQNAGKAVAKIVTTYTFKHANLIVGKGNNGGDALVCGIELLSKGYSVSAYLPFNKAHEKYLPLFKQAGGTLSDTFKPGILIDGLFGTGFTGSVDATIAKKIESFDGPIIAIDIPSGIHASATVTLATPKLELFSPENINRIGKLYIADIGLDISKTHACAYMIDEKAMPGLLPKIERSRHKYQAGYVVAFAGSLGMPGAALLATLAALRSGAGIVRLFHPPGMEAELSSSPYELIKTPWDKETVIKELKRASSILIGPGGFPPQLKEIIHLITVPAVIDAEGLSLLTEKLPMPIIITPHRKEMQRLLSEEPTLENCQAYSEEKKVTIVLKGAPTFIFHPQSPPLIVNRGDPGMATAGSGDVLTGILAALLAQKMDLRESATLGAYLHAVAGEIAAKEMTSYDMIASDIIKALPDAFLKGILNN